jgi:outer membrane protein assembly complex protein YaeT
MVSRFAHLRCFLLALVFTVRANSQGQTNLSPPDAYEGKPIAEVRFDPPSQPVMRADLARVMAFRPGTPLHLAEVRTAIKKLYSTGLYSNIEIDTQPGPGGAVILVIRTTEQWFVGPVELQGKVNNPPNSGQLVNATRLQLGTPYEDADLQTAQKCMADLFQRNGLYLATIQPQIKRDAEHQQVALTFRVNSHKRARLSLPVIQGDTRIPAETVAKAAKYKGWFRWKPATDDNTQTGINNIEKKYAKQDRLTASVSLENMQYHAETNRVEPTIEAEGGPKVKIGATGAKLSKGKLQTYVPVWDEGTVDRDLLVSGVRNLRDYFQNAGYFDAAVEFSTKTISSDEQDITYTIDLGPRHKVVKVNVAGNHYFRTPEIRERMFIQPAGFLILRHGRYSDGFSERDRKAIEALYRDNGFRDVKVTIDVHDNYEGKNGNVAVTAVIEEGAQYKVSGLTIEGMTRKDKGTITRLLALSPGEPYSDTAVGMDRDYIQEVYQSSGYPDVEFQSRIAVDKAAHEVRVQYIVTEGRQRFVRDVLITGLHTTRHRLVDPATSVHAGDPLSWTEMGRMQRRLYNLGVFDKVDMAIQNPDGDTDSKYVLYNFTEGNRYNMAVGFGLEVANFGGSQTSLDNPAGTAGVAPRVDLEASRLNLWGLGHSINFKGRYSTLDRRLSLNYLAPRFHNVQGRNISVTGLYDNTRDVLTFTARRLEGSFQVSNQLSKTTTLLVRYTWRDVRIDPNTLKIDPGLIPLVSQPAQIAMIGGNLVQDRRDDPVNAHRGYYNTVDFGVAERYLGGSRNFTRFLARNSYYKRITGDWVLASNTQFGWIHQFGLAATDNPITYVPLAEHFFGGGSMSMRAFPENQAGPRDLTTGFPLGGDALLFHQTELRFPFLGANIQGVFFHDMGNIYTDLKSISFRTQQNGLQDFDYMVHAAGFGVRYKTPLGPVRLDLAYSINPPTFHGLVGTFKQLLDGTATPQTTSVSHFQFFFSIGQAF